MRGDYTFESRGRFVGLVERSGRWRSLAGFVTDKRAGLAVVLPCCVRGCMCVVSWFVYLFLPLVLSFRLDSIFKQIR